MAKPNLVQRAEESIKYIQSVGGTLDEPLVWQPGLSEDEVLQIESEMGRPLSSGVRKLVKELGSLTFCWSVDDEDDGLVCEKLWECSFGGFRWRHDRLLSIEETWRGWEPANFPEPIGFDHYVDLCPFYLSFDDTYYFENRLNGSIVVLSSGRLNSKVVFESVDSFIEFAIQIEFSSLDEANVCNIFIYADSSTVEIDHEFIQSRAGYRDRRRA